MQKDAKLGLVVGVGLVILIAVVFFRRDALPAVGSAAAVNAAGPSPAPVFRGQYRPVRAKPAAQAEPAASEKSATPEPPEAVAGN